MSDVRFLLPPAAGDRDGHSLDALGRELSERLGRPVHIETAGSYEELERAIVACETDVAWAPPALCARVEGGARAILTAVRMGQPSYRSALVRRAGPAFAVRTLRGRTAAWVDPRSMAGYLLPIAYLRRLGLEPDRELAAQSFHGSYRAALQAVIDGAADIAAVHSSLPDETSVRLSLSEHVGNDHSYLVPFAYTDDCPADGLVFTARLASDAMTELLWVLLAADEPGHRGPLRELLDAQTFVLARPGDYERVPTGAGPATPR